MSYLIEAELDKILPPDKALLAVVHVTGDDGLTRANIAMARETGWDGAWLISHETEVITKPLSAKRLVDVYKQINLANPDFPLGISFADLDCFKALRKLQSSGIDPDWLWTENARTSERLDDHYSTLALIRQRSFPGWGGALFAATNYKGQEYQTNLAGLASFGRGATDVYVTSGPGTGQEADLDKIARTRKAVGENARLALASGVSIENIGSYAGDVNYFMVASSILVPGTEKFDPTKMRELADWRDSFRAGSRRQLNYRS